MNCVIPASCKILSEVEFKRGYKGSLQVACAEKVLERERERNKMNIYKYDAQNITVKFECIQKNKTATRHMAEY